MSEVSDTLDALACQLAPLGAIPGPMGIAARIAAVAFGAGAALARAGGEPAVEIERILAADPLVRGVHEEWAETIRRKFPRPSEPAPSGPKTLPDTAMGDDPYE